MYDYFFRNILLDLSAGALAFSKSNHTSVIFTFEERANNGWITTYAPSGPTCRGGYDILCRPRPEGGCVGVFSVSDTILQLSHFQGEGLLSAWGGNVPKRKRLECWSLLTLYVLLWFFMDGDRSVSGY